MSCGSTSGSEASSSPARTRSTRAMVRWPRLFEVLADGGQWWREVARLGEVIEPYDAHVLGHAQPGLVQGAQ